MGKGFSCTGCSTDDLPVIQTYGGSGYIRRRRKCPNCGTTFHTYEIAEALLPTTADFDFLFRKAPA